MTLISSGADFPLTHALTHLMPSLVLAPAGLSLQDCSALQQAGIPYYEPADEALRAAARHDATGHGGEAAVLTSSLSHSQVQHLAERSHRRIGYVSADVEAVRNTTEQRERAIVQAAQLAGVDCTHVVRLGPLEDVLEDCVRTLQRWRADGVSAVACFNDLNVTQVLKAARRLGWSVPGDLAVIGVHDEAMSWLLEHR